APTRAQIVQRARDGADEPRRRNEPVEPRRPDVGRRVEHAIDERPVEMPPGGGEPARRQPLSGEPVHDGGAYMYLDLCTRLPEQRCRLERALTGPGDKHTFSRELVEVGVLRRMRREAGWDVVELGGAVSGRREAGS